MAAHLRRSRRPNAPVDSAQLTRKAAAVKAIGVRAVEASEEGGALRTGQKAEPEGLSPILPQGAPWERHLVYTVLWWATYVLVLWPIRLVFGWLLPPLLRNWWHNGVWYHTAQDDRPVYEGVRLLAEEFPYGPHFRDHMDVLVPDPSAKALRGLGAVVYDAWSLLTCYPLAMWQFVSRRWRQRDGAEIAAARDHEAMLFVHGGGWCAVDASIQHHQSTVFARQGFAIYSINYPHAPEDPFPASTISTLRALRYLREVQGHQRVALVGESAGGNLATVAAALLANRHCLEDFAARARRLYGCEEHIEDWLFPQVTCVVSWYGILDVAAWRNTRWLWFGLSWCMDAHRGASPLPPLFRNGPDFAWSLTNGRGVHAERRLQRHGDPYVSLVCMSGNLAEYPAALLVAGSEDPLGLEHSTEAAFAALAKRFPGHAGDGKLAKVIKKAGHAFIGLNPFILYLLQGRNWREYAQAATSETLAFVQAHHRSDQTCSSSS